MLDLPPTPTLCEATMNFSKTVMERVNAGNLSSIKASYAAYSADTDKVILKKALENYSQKEPLTPSEFSIEIFNECISNKK